VCVSYSNTRVSYAYSVLDIQWPIPISLKSTKLPTFEDARFPYDSTSGKHSNVPRKAHFRGSVGIWEATLKYFFQPLALCFSLWTKSSHGVARLARFLLVVSQMQPYWKLCDEKVDPSTAAIEFRQRILRDHDGPFMSRYGSSLVCTLWLGCLKLSSTFRNSVQANRKGLQLPKCTALSTSACQEDCFEEWTGPTKPHDLDNRGIQHHHPTSLSPSMVHITAWRVLQSIRRIRPRNVGVACRVTRPCSIRIDSALELFGRNGDHVGHLCGTSTVSTKWHALWDASTHNHNN